MDKPDSNFRKEGEKRPSESDRSRREAFEQSLDRFSLSSHVRQMILEAGPPPNWNSSSC